MTNLESSSFNTKELDNIKSFKMRVAYCEQRLKRISSGSSRIVYQINNNRILKLAKNNKGIYQNMEEHNSYAIELGIGAETYSYNSDFLWIISEYAKKCIPSDFQRILGYNFNFIRGFIDSVKNEYNNRFYKEDEYQDFKEKIMDYKLPNSRWFCALYDYISSYQLKSIGDLQKISSWGIVTRNGIKTIVLIDMGLNDYIYNNFYSISKKSINEITNKLIKRIF